MDEKKQVIELSAAEVKARNKIAVRLQELLIHSRDPYDGTKMSANRLARVVVAHANALLVESKKDLWEQENDDA